jgi:mono/diheme cytochrome c family protein
MHRFVAGLAFATILVAHGVVGLQAEAQAVQRQTAPRIPSVDGTDNYSSYCAVCHGKDGKGNGPAAAVLKMPVPDLTTIAKRNGGAFKGSDVEKVIVGADRPAAHGSEEMPIWGPVFRAFDHDEATRTLRVKNLVQFIESLQIR